MQEQVLTFTNPGTGQVFGQTPVATSDEVRQAVQEMRQRFPAWSGKSIRERIRILRKFQALLIDRQDEITQVINQDCGKTRQDAILELFVTIYNLDETCRKAPGWLKTEHVSPGIYFFKKCAIEHRPHGVTAVIAPWNYPFALSLPPVFAALIAGNTVVLKPSELTAATGELIRSLIESLPDLAPYARVVQGDGRTGAALIAAEPDYIFITGSTPTGRKVMQAASERLIPAACELGGKDAMIVLEDADLDSAARWGAWGAYFNAGQTCMSVERVYVVEPVYDEFLRLALQYTGEFKTGYSSQYESDFTVGPLTDPRQAEIIQSHLDDALAKGARLLTGGKRDAQFFDPMVVVDVDHSMLLMQEESFGPFLPIMKVRDEAEAIRLANDNAFGLGASVWGRDVAHALEVARKIEAASIIINDSIAQFGMPMMPFGGVKGSGFGRTHGREGLTQFTRPYSYVAGNPPLAWDIATILRKPGNYHTGAALTGLLFGRTWAQRIKAFKQLFNRP
ncbi:MAG: aldehyde dehydrogenase family protein [Anaerolineales bacterium]